MFALESVGVGPQTMSNPRHKTDVVTARNYGSDAFDPDQDSKSETLVNVTPGAHPRTCNGLAVYPMPSR